MTHRVALATAAALLLAAALAGRLRRVEQQARRARPRPRRRSQGAAARPCSPRPDAAAATHSPAPTVTRWSVPTSTSSSPTRRRSRSRSRTAAAGCRYSVDSSHPPRSARGSGSACPPWTCATPAEASVGCRSAARLLLVGGSGAPGPMDGRRRGRPSCRGLLAAVGSVVGRRRFGLDHDVVALGGHHAGHPLEHQMLLQPPLAFSDARLAVRPIGFARAARCASATRRTRRRSGGKARPLPAGRSCGWA